MPCETTLRNLEPAIYRLFAYCEANHWAGYDPYDALNSRIFEALPFLNSRLPRLALIQAFKRSPINLRPISLVPKTQNPKAIALFLASLITLIRAGQECDQRLLQYFVDRLVAMHPPVLTGAGGTAFHGKPVQNWYLGTRQILSAPPSSPMRSWTRMNSLMMKDI